MRKGFQLTALSGALILAMMSNVSANDTNANNITFDGWSVAGGVIDATTSAMCQTTYSCAEVAAGDGFKQLTVSDNRDAGSGVQYVMTIVTDQGVTGSSANVGFSDVSMIRMDLSLGGGAQNNANNQSGIFAKQQISSGGTAFVASSTISTGWSSVADANGIIPPNIQIRQALADDNGTNTFAGDDFASNFLYNSSVDSATGSVSGYEMSIDQSANLGNQAIATSANDTQTFALRQKSGVFLTAASPGGGLDANGDGTGVSWVAGAAGANPETVKAIWIGQEIELGGTGGGAGALLGSSFGYLAFENMTTGNTQPIDSGFGFSTNESASAWVWDPAFNVVGSAGFSTATGEPAIR